MMNSHKIYLTTLTKGEKLFSFPPHSQPKIFPTSGPTNTLETLLQNISPRVMKTAFVIWPPPWLLPSFFLELTAGHSAIQCG